MFEPEGSLPFIERPPGYDLMVIADREDHLSTASDYASQHVLRTCQSNLAHVKAATDHTGCHLRILREITILWASEVPS